MGGFLNQFSQTRRTILKLILPLGILVWGGWRVFLRKTKQLWSAASYPVQNANIGVKQFSGDHPEKTHAFLWNKEKSILDRGGLPEPREHFKVAVVGAGIAGLSAAHFLKHLHPVVLDQSNQFGGNSRGERNADSLFSIGAAYIVPSDENSVPFKLLNDLGISSSARVHEGELQVLEKNGIRSNFWSPHMEALKKLKSIYDTKYPAVPFDSEGSLTKADFNELDKISFYDWSKKNLSKSTELEAFLRGYCYSSFGGDLHELSTAQVLSFLTSDLSSVAVFPGGNSFIAQELCKSLISSIPIENMRPKTLAVDIRTVEQGVKVTYVDQEDRLQAFTADSCIMAGPKFVALKLIDQLGEQQKTAIKAIKYRAYLVINILLNKKIPAMGYDIFNLNALMSKPLTLGPSFTDLIFADWAMNYQTEKSVLTLYKPVPLDHGRALLYTPSSYDLVLKEIEDGLSSLLRTLNLNRDDVLDIQIARHGHALPLAGVDMLASGTLEKAHSSIDRRIFFANQDNWANPCFETAVVTADQAAKEIML